MRILLVIGLFLLVSCQVTRQRSASIHSREQIDIKETAEISNLMSRKAIAKDREVFVNSGGSNLIEIKPRGSFRLLPDGTFEGEAEEIRSFRRDTTSTKERGSFEYLEVDSVHSVKEERSVQIEQELQTEEERETRRRPGWIVWLFLMAVAALVFLFVMARIKRFRIF